MLVHLPGYLEPQVGSSWAWLTAGNHVLVNWELGCQVRQPTMTTIPECSQASWNIAQSICHQSILTPLFTTKTVGIFPFLINARTHTHMKLITVLCDNLHSHLLGTSAAWAHTPPSSTPPTWSTCCWGSSHPHVTLSLTSETLHRDTKCW